MMDQQSLLACAEALEVGASDGNPNFFFHHATHADGTIVISADQGALREFAGRILRLIAKPDGDMSHCSFDGLSFSESGSQPMVIARTEERQKL
jgi:hypothetical protein